MKRHRKILYALSAVLWAALKHLKPKLGTFAAPPTGSLMQRI